MQLTKTFPSNSAIFIEKKKVENSLLGKSRKEWILWRKKMYYLQNCSHVSEFVANFIPRASSEDTHISRNHSCVRLQMERHCQAFPDPPGPLLLHHPARSCLPSQLYPASHARRPGPPSPPTRPAIMILADQAIHVPLTGPPCPQTRLAKPANPPSEADQQGHDRCFGRDAVYQARVVSLSFLLT